MDSAAEASSAAREAPLLPEDVVARIEQLRGKSAAEGARTFREIATVVHQCSTQARNMCEMLWNQAQLVPYHEVLHYDTYNAMVEDLGGPDTAKLDPTSRKSRQLGKIRNSWGKDFQQSLPTWPLRASEKFIRGICRIAKTADLEHFAADIQIIVQRRLELPFRSRVRTVNEITVADLNRYEAEHPPRNRHKRRTRRTRPSSSVNSSVESEDSNASTPQPRNIANSGSKRKRTRESIAASSTHAASPSQPGTSPEQRRATPSPERGRDRPRSENIYEEDSDMRPDSDNDIQLPKNTPGVERDEESEFDFGDQPEIPPNGDWDQRALGSEDEVSELLHPARPGPVGAKPSAGSTRLPSPTPPTAAIPTINNPSTTPTTPIPHQTALSAAHISSDMNSSFDSHDPKMHASNGRRSLRPQIEAANQRYTAAAADQRKVAEEHQNAVAAMRNIEVSWKAASKKHEELDRFSQLCKELADANHALDESLESLTRLELQDISFALVAGME